MTNRLVRYFRRYENKWKLEVLIAAGVLGVIVTVCLLPESREFPFDEMPAWRMNETTALVRLFLIHTAQETYYQEWGVYCGWDIAMDDESEPALLEVTAPERAVDGYYYVFRLEEGSWSCVAMPAEPGISGKNSYFIDKACEPRYAPCASPDDPPADGASERIGRG